MSMRWHYKKKSQKIKVTPFFSCCCGRIAFSNYSCRFLNPNISFWFELWLFYFFRFEKPPEQVKKAFCYQKLFLSFTVWMNCSSDLKKIANYWPSTFKSSHVVNFTLISNLATDYIQKRRGKSGLFSFECNLSPKLISK